MQTTERVYIVAGSVAEFRYYAQRKIQEATETQSPYPRYVWVSNHHILKGLTDIKGFYVGNYEKHPDIDQIKLQIKITKGKSTNKSSDFIGVYVNGVHQKEHQDYYLLNCKFSMDQSKTSSVIVEFTQAPPAGSTVTVYNIKGDLFQATGNGSHTHFAVQFK